MPATAGRSGRRAALTVLLSAVFLVLADVFIATVATPAIRADLEAGMVHIQLALSLYNIAYGALLLGGARLGDRFGQRRLFLVGCSIFCLASLMCALAPNAETLVVARLLQGIGPALLMPQVFTFIQDRFTGRARFRAFAAFSAVSGVAAAGSQVIGGALIDLDLFGLGWRTIFWVNVPIMIVIMAAAAVLLPGSHGRRTVGIDWPGLTAFTLCLVALTSTLALVQHSPGTGVIAGGLTVLGLVLTRAALRRAELRGEEPVLDTGLLHHPRFRLLLAASVVYYAGNAVLFSLLPIYLITVMGSSATAAGSCFAALAGTFAVTSALVPRIASRSPRSLLLAGSAGLVATYGVLAGGLLLSPRLSPAALVPLLVLTGAAMGLTAPSLNTLATRYVPSRSTGTASGLITTALEIGYGLGATLGIGGYAMVEPYVGHAGHALAASVGLAAALALALTITVRRATGSGTTGSVDRAGAQSSGSAAGSSTGRTEAPGRHRVSPCSALAARARTNSKDESRPR